MVVPSGERLLVEAGMVLFAGGGGMAEWLASPDWDREGVGSNPGVARSDGQ